MSKQTAPARLLVAWYKISSNAPAGDEITALISVMQNSNTTRNAKLLVAPMRTAKTIARGAWICGSGISSTMWLTLGRFQSGTLVDKNKPTHASKPVKPNALCKSPKIQATPLFHPVSFTYPPNTNPALSYLGLEQAKHVILMTTTPIIDHVRAARLIPGRSRTPNVLIKNAPSIHTSKIRKMCHRSST